MIVGTAIVPTAPLLVADVSPSPPAGVAAVRQAVDAALAGVGDADAAVLISAGTTGLHDSVEASLAAVGRPDVARPVDIRRDALARVAAATGCPLRGDGQLPLGLAVLALLGAPRPLVPLTVAASCDFHALAALGRGIARALAGRHLRAAVVAAGDLSAGLSEDSPLHRVEGAAAWDADVVAAVRGGGLAALAGLGPAEAARMGALGWAPLAVLQGVCARVGMAPAVRHYSAPRGVGYLVAQSAGGDPDAHSAGGDPDAHSAGGDLDAR